MHNDIIELGRMNATWMDGTSQTFETVGLVILPLICLVVGTTSAINFYVYLTADYDMFLYFVIASALEFVISVGQIVTAFLSILNVDQSYQQVCTDSGNSTLSLVSNVFLHLCAILLCMILLAASLTRWAALRYYVWYYSFRNNTILPKLYALTVLAITFAVYLVALVWVSYFYSGLWNSSCTFHNSLPETVFLANIPALVIIIFAFCFILHVHIKMNNPSPHSSIPANKNAKLRNVNLLWRTSLTFIATLIISIQPTLAPGHTYLTGYIRSVYMLHLLFNIFFYYTYIQEYKKRVQELFTAVRTRYKGVEGAPQLEIFV